jgi:hypothetical protein
MGLLKSYYDQENLSKKRTAYLQLKNNIFLKNVRNDQRFQKMLAEHKALYDEYMKKYGDVDI